MSTASRRTKAAHRRYREVAVPGTGNSRQVQQVLEGSHTFVPVPGTGTSHTGTTLAGRSPVADVRDIHREHRAVGRLVAVLRVLLLQQRERVLALLALVEHARAAAEADPPEPAPVLVVVVDEDRDVRSDARVLDPPQCPRALRLAVDGRVEGVAVESEHDWDEVRPSVRIDRRQPGDAC